MKIQKTPIQDLLVLIPTIHRDARGFFMETFRASFFEELGYAPFIQDNHAKSAQVGTLRGLHYQKAPAAQSKLIWVLQGSIYDVAVDLRADSPTYGQWFGLILTSETMHRLLIPQGFAHGYMTLEPNTEVAYKVDNYYAPEHEGGLRWNDPTLAITWPKLTPIIADRDAQLPLLQDFTTPFKGTGSL